ncbi:hypothetical protein BHM03_00062680 [Ensete ventricosum]|nr:hypothetical protein BHM03_00062680 [Ensete ventricosum]
MADTLKNTCSIDLIDPKKLGSRNCLLPNDVLEAIISYLPTKAFVKFLSICKTFYQLSSDSRFLFSQSYYNKAISGFVVRSDNILMSIIIIDPYAGVPRSNLKFIIDMESIILGSAGGLIFVLNKKYEGFDASICVYNPARGTRCWLPAPSGECTSGGIAVRFMNDEDGVSKGYKLVYLTHTNLGIEHIAPLSGV